MNRGNKAKLVSSDVKHKYIAHLIGAGEECSQLCKIVPIGFLAQAIPLIQRSGALGMRAWLPYHGCECNALDPRGNTGKLWGIQAIEVAAACGLEICPGFGDRGHCNRIRHDDATLRFWQEIYDDQGRLVEIHEKYPLDEGHRKV